MCDYSLMAIPNRLAEQGEDLVTHRFPTGSLGLASPSDFCSIAEPAQAHPAVCIPPGARLMLQDIPAYLQLNLKVGPVEEVTFTQLTAAVNTHRDAVRFKNGRQICLQELRAGQRVRVLALSSAEAFEPVREERPELQFRLR